MPRGSVRWYGADARRFVPSPSRRAPITTMGSGRGPFPSGSRPPHHGKQRDEDRMAGGGGGGGHRDRRAGPQTPSRPRQPAAPGVEQRLLRPGPGPARPGRERAPGARGRNPQLGLPDVHVVGQGRQGEGTQGPEEGGGTPVRATRSADAGAGPLLRRGGPGPRPPGAGLRPGGGAEPRPVAHEADGRPAPTSAAATPFGPTPSSAAGPSATTAPPRTATTPGVHRAGRVLVPPDLRSASPRSPLIGGSDTVVTPPASGRASVSTPSRSRLPRPVTAPGPGCPARRFDGRPGRPRTGADAPPHRVPPRHARWFRPRSVWRPQQHGRRRAPG